MELRRLSQSYYALAATLIAAGLADILFVYEPRFILIDEVERLSRGDGQRIDEVLVGLRKYGAGGD